jgi:hypothetical protein
VTDNIRAEVEEALKAIREPRDFVVTVTHVVVVKLRSDRDLDAAAGVLVERAGLNNVTIDSRPRPGLDVRTWSTIRGERVR